MHAAAAPLTAAPLEHATWLVRLEMSVGRCKADAGMPSCSQAVDVQRLLLSTAPLQLATWHCKQALA